MIKVDNRVEQSYEILDKLRLPNGLYVASTSSTYNFIWLRDTFYEVMPYLNKSCGRYASTYHRILDIFREYEWKLDIHTKQKPIHKHEYMHPRYTADTVREVPMEWGNCQHDATGAILFGIGEGIKVGKKMLRDEKDREIVQKLVRYLEICEFWHDSNDNGIWEENPETRSSSLAACIAGLKSVRNVVDVPEYMIEKGMLALYELFPFETKTRKYDLSQLSLIYPYNLLDDQMSKIIVKQVEENLLRDRGVIRYIGDSYYSTLEKEHGRGRSRTFYEGTEAEWCFGLPWLSICHNLLSNKDKAKEYIEWTEKVMLEDGSLPELYYSKCDIYNENSPLGWSNSLYIQSKEAFSNFNK